MWRFLRAAEEVNQREGVTTGMAPSMDVDDCNVHRHRPTLASFIASVRLRRIVVGAVRGFKTFVLVGHAVRNLFAFLYRFIVFHVRPFWIELSYFVLLAFLGSLLMSVLRPRSASSSVRYVDMLYMSTSAVTVSGLNSVDIETFSESQIVVLSVLMLVGGEVFVSFLNLVFRRLNNAYVGRAPNNIMQSVNGNAGGIDSVMDVTVRMAPPGVGCDQEMQQQNHHHGFIDRVVVVSSRTSSMENILEMVDGDQCMKQRAVKRLGYVVLGYIVFFHVAGFTSVFVYYSVVPSARRAIEYKGLSIATFAATTTVSSFANGGIIPASESMGKFKADPGLLLMLITQILGGNTLYPAFLRSALWVLRKLKPLRSPELDVMIENPQELEYPHLFSVTDVLLQSFTSVGILSMLVALFAAMSWNSGVLSDLTPFQKSVGVLFQSVNSRHTGEAIFDFSMIAPAVLVLFIFSMYLPAYTSFKWDGHGMEKKQSAIPNGWNKDHKGGKLASQLTYILFFVVTACVLERKSISTDPANFSVLAVVFEIVSAYGNVGLSMGYRCGRRLPTQGHGGCEDGGYSFSGRWSDAGKLLVVFIMLFGRLKSYHMGGGKLAWRFTPPNF